MTTKHKMPRRTTRSIHLDQPTLVVDHPWSTSSLSLTAALAPDFSEATAAAAGVVTALSTDRVAGGNILSRRSWVSSSDLTYIRIGTKLQRSTRPASSPTAKWVPRRLNWQVRGAASFSCCVGGENQLVGEGGRWEWAGGRGPGACEGALLTYKLYNPDNCIPFYDGALFLPLVKTSPTAGRRSTLERPDA